MPAENSRVEHSSEVQEIMGHVPHWLIRWGVGLLFFILLTILGGSYFIKYPMIITSPFVLTTLNSPSPLVVKKSGRVAQWLVKDGERVEAGRVIAVLDSDADYLDILFLNDGLKKPSGKDQYILNQQDQLVLGSAQNEASDFFRALEGIAQFSESQNYTNSRALILSELERKKEYHRQMLQHRKVKQQEFTLMQNKFRQDSGYYRKGGYGISLADYESTLQHFLQEKAAFISYEASFYEHEAAIAKTKKALTVLTITHEEKRTSLQEKLRQTRQKLSTAISDWKSQNLIMAPTDGILTLTKYWSENQVLKAGEVLATVVPEERAEIIGRAMVASNGIGKVKVGQKVNIKLSGFPALQYGTLKGSVKSISLVPEDPGYVVGIELSNGMTSSYKERLKFIQEMDGTAEIITESKRLIYKLLSL